jgi:Uma2 family endonuclease
MVTTREAKFTRGDYMLLPEGLRAELLDGVLVKEPGPTGWHQYLVGKIHHQLAGLVGLDRTVVSPIDVFVDDHNVLQPDILVLAESDAIRRGDRAVAVPILVIEVLSPATANRDRDPKVGIYLRAGVREVWLVDPETAGVEVWGSEGVESFAVGDTPASRAVPGFSLDLRHLLDV